MSRFLSFVDEALVCLERHLKEPEAGSADGARRSKAKQKIGVFKPTPSRVHSHKVLTEGSWKTIFFLMDPLLSSTLVDRVPYKRTDPHVKKANLNICALRGVPVSLVWAKRAHCKSEVGSLRKCRMLQLPFCLQSLCEK